MLFSTSARHRGTVVLAGVVAAFVAVTPLAVADNIQDSIVDEGSVALVAGSATAGTATVRVIANNADGPTTDPQCNWDTGEQPLVLDVVTPEGVTANPDPVSITTCNTNVTVSFTASASAVSGTATVQIVSSPAGGGGYANQVSIPITVTQPVPTNTKPTVMVTGVADGASYEIGSVPAAGCAVTDAEDGPSSFEAVVTGTLSHQLGTLTATCDYTDEGGLVADTATATYSVVDTVDPTISHTLTPDAPNANGWFNTAVAVDFTCGDTGSGIQSCDGDTVLGEGEDQTVTGTATDWAGNTATDTVSDIDVDLTAPLVALVGGPADGASYYFGSVPAAPTCDASDPLSGLDTCVVAGGGSTVGTHSYTATATDLAGNTSTATTTYAVLAWTLKGFYQPVDMSGVLNTVKGGSTVPLKFEVFAGPTELTDTSSIATFTSQKVTCTSGTGVEDAIEILSTGGTSLRYDATGGQFIQNWKTPTGAGSCYRATVTTQDGSSITALFKLK